MKRTMITAGTLAAAALVPFWAFEYKPLAAPSPATAATVASQAPANPTPADDGTIDAKPSLPVERVHEVGRGDTLIEILVDAGVTRGDAHLVTQALADHYRPRNLRPGHEIVLSFTNDADAATSPLTKLSIRPKPDREITVVRTDGGFQASEFRKPLKRITLMSAGTIRSSLYVAAIDAGVPPPLLMELERIFSWDVDFQREIHPNDGFELVYEQFRTEDDNFARHGRVLYANLILSGQSNPLYLHKTADGLTDYFDDKGQSARKALMKTPINGARLSSPYGRRRHPILGLNKMHRGIDFAAPRGTPIYAAGNGTIVHRARNGAYGRYVRIRHNAQYSTAYGHLHRFARKLNRGKRVKQGQIIGYVGTSGRSTGPHLHYEILNRGRQINPIRLKMPSGRKLKGAEQARLNMTRAHIATIVQRLSDGEAVATKNGD